MPAPPSLPPARRPVGRAVGPVVSPVVSRVLGTALGAALGRGTRRTATGLLAALVAAPLGVLGGGATAPAGAATVPTAPDDALEVTIDALTPSVVPDSGPLRVSGTLTNPSEDTWVAINLHAFVAATPIRSSEALAAAHEVDPAEYVGDRIVEPGTFAKVAEIAPGESETYSMRIPRSALEISEPGVYWFGVHAVGEGPQPRDDIADGRARTFLPLLPPRLDREVDTAVVVPVRHRVEHTRRGRVAAPRRWARRLELGGSLRSLVAAGAAAEDRPVTWLVDPAVPDAVRRLTSGNPPRSLADTVAADPGDGPDDDQGDDPGDDQGDGGGADASTSPEPTPEESPTAGPPEEAQPNAATSPGLAWLDRLQEAVTGDQVLALPYGDLDVSAALAHDAAAYDRARQRTGRELQPWGVPTQRAVAPPSGYLDPAALDAIEDEDTVVVGEQLLGGPGVPGLVEVAGRQVVVASSAGAGGPGPGDRLAAVPLRQQILAEAAVRVLQRRPPPLVVTLPPRWNPASLTGFWEGLDVPWLDLTDLDGLSATASVTGEVRSVPLERLQYPEAQADRELDAASFVAAEALVAAGETLQRVLLRNDRVAAVVLDEALTSLSYAARDRAAEARAATDRSRAWIYQRLGAVTIEAPPAVTLSSRSGRFSATLTNRLGHAVTVRVLALTDEPMVIEGPEEIEVAADGQTSVLLNATTDRLGVSNVELVVTDADGTPLGSTDTLPIRSAQVSRVIWLILAAGAALLFGAIVVRLVRRVRGSQEPG